MIAGEMTTLHRLSFVCKHLAAHLLQVSGVLALLRRRMLEGRAAVLMYHRVISPTERHQVFSHEGMVVETDAFEMQIRCLKKHFCVRSLEEILDDLKARRRFRSGSCLITFDDGWRDNFVNAFPVLAHYGVPATIFLSTGFVGTGRRFWQERLSEELACALRLAGADAQGKFKAVLDNHGIPHVIRKRRGHQKAVVGRIVQIRKRHTQAENEALISDLVAVAGEPAGSRPPSFFGWDDARTMMAGGITYGCHGEGHRILTRLAEEEALCEIRASREALETRLGVSPRAFAYPNGDFTPRIAAQVRACGFEAAFVTRKGLLDLNSDRYALGRSNIAGSMAACAPLFQARALGIF
ncbi:MAG TPA: polysaccharide deacetylase family protein [Candidatus Methanoperedens sp.]|nr:polysaccharide deacetylase family protein [Candidatus Methanoperedens sp.]